MSLLRKKKSTFDESDMPTDNWIWGNTRGGGGAPLKDVQGNDVANLKKVLAGTIEVDHSPSPNSKSKRNNSNRNSEYDDQDNGYNNRQNGRNNGNNAPNRNGHNRNNQGYDQNDDDEYDRRGGRNNSNHNNHPSQQSNQNNSNNRNQPQNNQNNGNAKRFNPYSDEAPQRAIPGLDNHSYGNNNRGGQDELPSPRHVHNNNGASPKKFMGALRELTGGNGERDAKQRKQAEYQEMLRQQIDEKNQKKDKEKREQDEVKRRELAEFMSSRPGAHQSGKPHVSATSTEADYPPAKKNATSVGRFRADSEDEGHNNRNSNNNYNNSNNSNGNKNSGGNKIPGLNMGGGGNKGRGGSGGGYSDEEEPEPRRRGHDDRDQGRRNNGGNTNNRAGRGAYDSEPDDHYSDDSRGGGRGRGGGGRNSAAADVVPAEEYDELSKLVDRLLTEKAQLQLTVDKQGDQLKALKGGSGKAGVPPRSRLSGSPSKPSIARSRSAIQPRERGGGDTASEEAPRAASNLRISKKELDRERAREAKLNLKAYEPISKNAKNAALANKARPSSMHAMGGSKGYVDESGGPKKAVKVAFGSNRNLDKNNTGGSRLAQQGAAVVKGGRKAEASPTKDNTPQGRYGQQPKRVGGGGMAERDNIGVNGFAKLQQANSRVVGGPVMVVHDEEEPSSRYNNARTPSPLRGNRGGGTRGLELRGNSEYIPINGDRDSIGGDQLEKLLRQSRNAR